MTKIKTYTSERQMNRDIKKMERRGYEVINIQRKEGQYGCLKTGCLGAIFLPLALTGKSKGEYIVIYKKAD